MKINKSEEISENLAEEIEESLFKSEEIMISDEFSSFTVVFNNPSLRDYYNKLHE